MGAREKLNQAHALGSVFLAGVAGILSGSAGVFVLVLIILLILSVASGDIRTSRWH